MLTALGDARVDMFSDRGSTPLGSTIQFHEREMAISLLWYMGIEGDIVKCVECGKDIELTEKAYEVNKNQAHIRIENVPAYVCECGEVYYSDEVFERIESILSELDNTGNKVIDFNEKNKSRP